MPNIESEQGARTTDLGLFGPCASYPITKGLADRLGISRGKLDNTRGPAHSRRTECGRNINEAGTFNTFTMQNRLVERRGLLYYGQWAVHIHYRTGKERSEPLAPIDARVAS